MPIDAVLTDADSFTPEQVAMLNHIYTELTLTRGFSTDKAVREALARRIIDQFRAGVVEPAALKEACAQFK